MRFVEQNALGSLLDIDDAHVHSRRDIWNGANRDHNLPKNVFVSAKNVNQHLHKREHSQHPYGPHAVYISTRATIATGPKSLSYQAGVSLVRQSKQGSLQLPCAFPRRLCDAGRAREATRRRHGKRDGQESTWRPGLTG